MGQYIGARYVPKFMGLYDPTQIYEALDVVDNGLGTSYISKIPTPAGTPLTNTTYWAIYGATSGAIINLQNQIDDMQDGTVPGSLQNQIDINTSGIQALASGFTNVLTLGVKNDGSEDCSDIINTNNDKSLYFPAGIYRFDDTIRLKHSIIGQGTPRNWLVNKFLGTVLKFTMTNNADHIQYIDDLDEESITISNISIECTTDNTGITINLNTDNSLFCIHDIGIVNAYIGIKANPRGGSSRYIHAYNVNIWGVYKNPKIGSCGIVIEHNAYDSFMYNLAIFAVQICVDIKTDFLTIIGSQFWCAGDTNDSTYYNNSKCIKISGTGIKLSHIYLDSAPILISCESDSKVITVENCNGLWGDYAKYSASQYNAPTVFWIGSDKTSLHITDVYLLVPFSTWYLTNRPANLIGDPIIDGWNNFNAFALGKASLCNKDDSYKLALKLSDGNFQEIAKVNKNNFALFASIGVTSVLIRAVSGAISYCDIGMHIVIWYKDNGDHASIYAQIGGDSDVTIRAISGVIANLDNTLFNGERMTLAKQSDSTGLTEATRFYWINT